MTVTPGGRLGQFLGAARESGPIVAVNVVGMGLAVLLQFVLARLLGAEEFGVYAYAHSWLNILSYLAIFGHDILLLRQLAVYRARGEWELHRALWHHASLFSAVASVGIAFTVAIVLYTTDWLAAVPAALLSMTMLALPILSFVRLGAAAAAAEGWPVRGNIPERLGRNIAMFVLIAMALAGGMALDAWLAMTMFTLSTAAAAAMFWAISRPRLRGLHTMRAMAGRGRVWLREASLFGLNGAGQLVLARTDVVMIGLLLGAADVGPYVLAAALAELVAFPQAAIAALWGPRLAAQYGHHDSAGLRATAGQARLFVAGSGLGLGVVVLLTGPWLLELVGKDFAGGAVPLAILVGAQMLRSLFGPVQLALNMTGRERQALKVVVVMAAGNILLNAWLIPMFGIAGAAVATGIVLVAGAVVMLSVFRRTLSVAGTG
jgi:O-antigen/teichoic acid export membrane protein